MRKLSVICLFFIVSCSYIDTNRIAPGYTEAFKAIDIAIFGYPENEISTAVIRSIPYASSLVKIGKGPIGLMILSSKENDIETWVSADGVKIFIYQGRIIRTSGLTNNLVDYVLPKGANLFSPHNLKLQSYKSFEKPELINLEVQIFLYKKGKQMVKLHDREIELYLIEEEVINNELGWSRVNKYWLDDQGFVWKSEQFVSPRLPKFQIEITKKPS